MTALLDWHFGEMDSCQATMAEAIALAKELNDMHGLAFALCYAAFLGYCERNPAEVERLASDVIELSTRHHFAHWLVMRIHIFAVGRVALPVTPRKASRGSRTEYETIGPLAQS